MIEGTPGDFGLPAAKFSTYRPKQLDLALDIVSSDARFRFMDVPTGGGKSAIYVTVAKIIKSMATEKGGGRTLVLVGTRGLQKQLADDFTAAGMFLVQGQRNYACLKLDDRGGRPGTTAFHKPNTNRFTLDTTCDHGPCKVGVKCPLRQGGCLYYDAVLAASRAEIVVSNYAQWLSLSRHADPYALGKFDLLVADEAHGAPDWLSEFCSIDLNRSEIKSVMSLDLPSLEEGVAVWAAWGRAAATTADAELSTFQERIKKEHWQPSHDDTKRMLRVQRLAREFHALGRAHAWKRAESSAKGVMAPGAETDWVAQETPTGQKFSPVWAHAYAEEALFRGIPNVLLSSATLTPAVGKYLGIPQSHSSWHEMPSSFPRRRRPFIISTIARVDHRMGDGEKRLWVSHMDRFIGERLRHKGIIHTVSYARAREIMSMSKFAEYMVTHEPRNFREVIEKFKRADAPMILVSPSVVEGYDFPGNEARWQIICKVPFPDGRDLVFKARKKSDDNYGNYLASLAIMQMAGRIVRSQSDWGETLIVDEHFGWFSRKVKWARWFKESWQWRKVLPPPLHVVRETT